MRECCVANSVSLPVKHAMAAACATVHIDYLANLLLSPNHDCSSGFRAKYHQLIASSHKQEGSAGLSAHRLHNQLTHMCVQGCKDNAVDGRPRIKNLEQ